MDFAGLGGEINRADRKSFDGKAFSNISNLPFGRATFSTDRLYYIIDVDDDAPRKVMIYGYFPVDADANPELLILFSEAADRNCVSYCNMNSIYKELGGEEFGTNKYFSFAMEPRLYVKGDVTKCALQIHDALDDFEKVMASYVPKGLVAAREQATERVGKLCDSLLKDAPYVPEPVEGGERGGAGKC